MEPEHQEHLCRPAPDALHLGQRRDHFFVVHRIERVERHDTVERFLTQIPEVANLLTAHSDRTHLVVVQCRHCFGGDASRHECNEAAEDRCRGFGRELLSGNRAYESGEVIVALRLCEAALTVLADQSGENRISAEEKTASFRVIGWRQSGVIIHPVRLRAARFGATAFACEDERRLGTTWELDTGS